MASDLERVFVERALQRGLDRPANEIVASVVAQFEASTVTEEALRMFIANLDRVAFYRWNDRDRGVYVDDADFARRSAWAIRFRWECATGGLPATIERQTIWVLIVHGQELALRAAVWRAKLRVEPGPVDPPQFRSLALLRDLQGPIGT